MNKIEELFYDEFIKVDASREMYFNKNIDEYFIYSLEIKQQHPIDIYIVDFLINDEYIIEIDGHESHKTKEQRYKDYKRERYFISKGYIVIKFTGSEVYVDSENCVLQTFDIIINDLTKTDNEEIRSFLKAKKYFHGKSFTRV